MSGLMTVKCPYCNACLGTIRGLIQDGRARKVTSDETTVTLRVRCAECDTKTYATTSKRLWDSTRKGNQKQRLGGDAMFYAVRVGLPSLGRRR